MTVMVFNNVITAIASVASVLLTENIVKKANKRMEILRRISPFGATKEEMTNIYILYIRSLLEQSCTVWHSSLTVENTQDLERVQKTALKIILQNEYKSYESALQILDLENLVERRERLCLQFAKKMCKSSKNEMSISPQKQNSPNENKKSRFI